MTPEPSPENEKEIESASGDRFEGFCDAMVDVIRTVTGYRLAAVAVEHDLQSAVQDDTRVRRLDPDAPGDHPVITETLQGDDRVIGDADEYYYAIEHRTSETESDEWEHERYILDKDAAEFIEVTIPAARIEDLIRRQQRTAADADRFGNSEEYSRGVEAQATATERELFDLLEHAVKSLSEHGPDLDLDDVEITVDRSQTARTLDRLPIPRHVITDHEDADPPGVSYRRFKHAVEQPLDPPEWAGVVAPAPRGEEDEEDEEDDARDEWGRRVDTDTDTDTDTDRMSERDLDRELNLAASPFSEGDHSDYYDLDEDGNDRTGRGPRSD